MQNEIIPTKLDEIPQEWKDSLRQSEIAVRIESVSETNLVFLKSWNEWGEGNYMEPDLKWGRQYLETLKKVFEK